MPSPRVSLASLALATLTLGAACLQGARVPHVTPNGVLVPGAEPGNAAPNGAFAVVFGAPHGATEDPSEITLVFNRPVRPLELAGEEAKPPVTIAPAVRGRWQWVGTSALQFVPDGHLPRATKFRVEVPADLRAQDGTALGKPYVLSFSTARPSLVRTEPPENDQHLDPSAKLVLRFDQPVADAEIRRALALVVGAKNESVPFDVRRPDPQNGMLAEIAPRTALPKDAAIELRVAESLRGTEGELPAGKARTFSYRTYGPLEVSDFRCDDDTPHRQCASSGGMSLTLSNRVRFGDLRRAISFEPSVPIAWGDRDDDDLVEDAWLPVKLVPGRTYRLRVRASLPAAKGGAAWLRDEHGQALAHDWVREVKTDDLWPAVEIGVAGSYLEPAARRTIPVAAVNTDFDLAVAPLDENAVLALSDRRPGRRSSVESLVAVTHAKVERVRPAAPKNVAGKRLVETDAVLGGKDRRGPIAIAASWTARPNTPDASPAGVTRIVQVTDLAITAKVSFQGSLVWVTRLSNGAPVAGARVELRRPGQVAGPFTTDAEGVATVPEDEFRPAWGAVEDAIVFVRTADDFAYRAVADQLDSWRFGASSELRPDERPLGLIFTERGIYRPGDVVHVKGIVRQPTARGTETPAGKTCAVGVWGPEGDEVQKSSVTLSEFGTFALDVKVPATGKLGGYRIAGKLEGSTDEWPDVSGEFQVAEYRPAEFKVSVESDRPSYVRGDEASFVGGGDFLFGAPMANADVRTTITRAPAYFSPPDLPERFTTSDDAWSESTQEEAPRSNVLASGDGKLDGKGAIALSASLALPGQRTTERVTCEVEVTDVSRQALASSTTAIVHPGSFYVALAPATDSFVKAGDKVGVAVLAVDPKGARRAGVPVHLDLVRRTWSAAREATGGARLHTVVHPVDKVVGGCDVTTKNEPVSCDLLPDSGGYYLVRGKAQDERGNPIRAAFGLYALGGGEAGWGDNDQLRVELVADKKSYAVGQRARILVKSPFKTADALVTVERAGIASQRRVTLSGATPTIEVPITDELRPNAFVSVVLLRGRTKAQPSDWKAPDVGAPSFREGYVELPIDAEARRLSVTVKPSKRELLPGESIDVDVDVRDKAGEGARAEVTLYAVDEGVLSLVGYKTPDPLPVFSAPRPLRVATIESLEDLAKITMAPNLVPGTDKGFEGGGGGESSGVRRDFRQSVYFNPSLVTDARGHAKVSFKLPESLTTYRVMAVATAKDDRFGYGEDRVVTSRPLMARPAFPRIVRAGDALEAGIVVSSKGLPKTSVEVEAKADGLVLASAAKRTVELAANGSEEVRFAFQAPRATKAKVVFRVRGGGASDAVEVTREITAPAVPEAVALYGDTTHESGEKLGDLSAIRDDVGGLEVALSSTALVGLGDGVEQLLDYPYGCTEQLTSRLVPLLPLRDLARDYGIALPKDVDRTVVGTVAKVLANQRGDGGFGMWPDSPRSSPWVTAYALWGLGEAKRRGAEVPERAIDEATAYVRRALDGWNEYLEGPPTAAFIVDVLALNGAPDHGWEDRIYDARDGLPLFGRALLAHAMATSHGDPKALEELSRDLQNHLRSDGPNARAVDDVGDRYAVLMDSEARTSALVLRALVAMDPAQPLAARLAMGLLADRRGGTWRSTQETAWALLALDDYRRAQEKTPPDFDARVFLGPTELYAAAFHGRSTVGARTNVPASRLVSAGGATLAFSVDGEGRLFYQARLSYARKEMPRDALDRGFFVKKTLRAVSPEALADASKVIPASSQTTFRGGDLVMGDVVVVTPSPREFVVVDDPLPAGLEPVDTSLATTAGSLRVAETGGENDAVDDEEDDDARDDAIATGRAYLPSWVRKEMRDDRVLFFVDHMAAGMYHYRYLARATTFGTFVLPPTRAEQMYVPEVFGRNGAAVVKVESK